MNLALYQGTDANSASLISNTALSGNINFGASSALYIGNRQDRLRSFNGWIDDFRFYTGAGDLNFVENVRLRAALPSINVAIQSSGTNLTLNWPYGTLQSATNFAGPWDNITNATSPYVVAPDGLQQFYRIKLQ